MGSEIALDLAVGDALVNLMIGDPSKREHMVIYALIIVAVIGLAVAVVFN